MVALQIVEFNLYRTKMKLHKSDVHLFESHLSDMIVRALPDEGWGLMCGWYYGMITPNDYETYPKQTPLLMFNRHIKAGRLNRMSLSEWTGQLDVDGYLIFPGDIVLLEGKEIVVDELTKDFTKDVKIIGTIDSLSKDYYETNHN